MADNFDLRQFLFENKLGSYSKTVSPVNEEQVNEEDYDLKRDLIGALGPNPTIGDVAKHLNKSYDEAEFLMKRLGMTLYRPSYAAKGGFRQNYAQQDRADRERKALRKLDGEEGPTAGEVASHGTLNSIENPRNYPRFRKVARALRGIASKANDINHFKNIVKKYAEKAGAEITDQDFEQGKPLFRYWDAYTKLSRKE